MTQFNGEHREPTDMQVYNLHRNDVQKLAIEHGKALGAVIEAMNSVYSVAGDILADTEHMRETMRGIFDDQYGHAGNAHEWLADDYEETVRRNHIVEKHLVPAEKQWAEICKQCAADRHSA